MPKQWVIPDIHGYSNTLKALVEQQIKPSKHDWLYFLGDYIDRGPDSRGVIDYINSLIDNEYNVRLLKGNHEDYCVKAYDNELLSKKPLGFSLRNPVLSGWKQIGGKESLESFGAKSPLDIPEEYIEWMRKLEMFIHLDKYLLVHAGLNFDLEDPFEDEYSMLWIRDFDIKPEKIANRTLVHGHMPVNLELIYYLKDNPGLKYIDLDNGIYFKNRDGFGNLVAMELGTRDLAVQYNIDEN